MLSIALHLPEWPALVDRSGYSSDEGGRQWAVKVRPSSASTRCRVPVIARAVIAPSCRFDRVVSESATNGIGAMPDVPMLRMRQVGPSSLRPLCFRTVELRTRRWIITDAQGKVELVEGEGVVGEQPRILPGKFHRYSSGAVLETPVIS